MPEQAGSTRPFALPASVTDNEQLFEHPLLLPVQYFLFTTLSFCVKNFVFCLKWLEFQSSEQIQSITITLFLVHKTK